MSSVCFVWAVSGSGSISSGGEAFDLDSTSLLRLPWLHDVTYSPNQSDPFHLGTIHVVPRHDLSVVVEPRVAFLVGDPLLTASWRRGPEQRERAMLVDARSVNARNLISLASYGIERFFRGDTDEASLRSLAQLIMAESAHLTGSESRAHANPIMLDQMIEYILANLASPLSVSSVAHVGACSTTTAERLFVRHTGLSVVAWSRRRRMQEAAILLRSSGLRIGEVARRVGYTDPLYFSRVFSSVYNMSPSRYAAAQLKP